jgi:hypothetical protein
MLTDEDLCKLEGLLGNECANDVALAALFVGASQDPESPGAVYLAEANPKPSETKRKLLEVGRLAGEIAELLTHEDVRLRLTPWQLEMMGKEGVSKARHLGGPAEAARSALGIFSDTLSYLSAGASTAADKVPARRGPRADIRADLLARAVAHHMHRHGLRVSSAQGSKLVNVLGLLWSRAGLSGSAREAARRVVRQPKHAPEPPSATGGQETPTPTARGWWGGELPE